MPLGQKEFVARVVEVANADALVVRLPSTGKHQKIFFSSLRPPRWASVTDKCVTVCDGQ